MSQSKTVVPGMEESNSHEKVQSADFYSRGANAKPAKGTVVPGINNGYKSSQSQEPAPDSSQYSGKPVVGFLYSISRQGIGEYWPLYLGQNTIGSSPLCSICLREGTVSEDHAVLVIRKMKNPEKTIASISDTRSTNGTMLNKVSLDFSATECFNEDIITIGENYELVLILLNVKSLGLKVSENFITMDNTLEGMDTQTSTPYSPDATQNLYPPKFEVRQDYNNDYHENSNATVGMDGSNGVKHGGTIGI